ncbi:MAG: phenylalanine--tRNA ligase subunit alpha [Alphaproteobacteria bacterium]|nr:phenylalanine--tRNA ligase subunit alpha [Alphaproteobacteria bacterium]
MATLENWQQQLDQIQTLDALEQFKSLYLGKTGLLTQEMKTLSALSVDEKKEKGRVLNVLREDIQTAISAKKDFFEDQALNAKINAQAIDVTLPIRPIQQGKRHLLSQIMDDIESYFARQGFQLRTGPDVDTEDYNFNALNIPHHHPARQSQDTFYLESNDTGNKNLLRTHTSNIQIHVLKNEPLPMRILALGRAYRSDAIDATHTPMFHQAEIFAVDRVITMGHLKSTIINFLRHIFDEKDLQVRFRPSFFPFTEPSAEVDIKMPGRDWLEILGCGLIHPQVLANCGIDHQQYQGFAAGLGIERIAMLKYGITDIRQLYENDLRFLQHYGSVA